MIARLLFLLMLIGVNAFFAASEIALISLNDNKMNRMAEEGNAKAQKLVSLLKEPSGFLATIQIGITLAGFLASAYAAESFADPIVQFLKTLDTPISESLLRIGTVLVITLVLSYFTLVMGELVPKRIGMNKAETIAFAVVGTLTLLAKAAHPFVRFLTWSTNRVVRLFGIDPHSVNQEVTEEEIRLLVDVGEETGAIDKREKVLINNIFDFDNKTVEDIMTHRVEIFGVPVNTSLKNLIQELQHNQYSRVPVFKDNLDHIVGILYVKDLLSLIIQPNIEKEFQLSHFIRRPLFVPMRKNIDELLLELQREKNHMAIVLDEYGGTAGIVTMEDLVEEIVGNIFDEYDKEEDEEWKVVGDNLYEVKGTISLYELENYLDTELPVEEFDTLSGLLIHLLGNVFPNGPMEMIRYKNLEIQIMDVTEKRIESVRIRIV